jgi:hypothetical protein
MSGISLIEDSVHIRAKDDWLICEQIKAYDILILFS